MPTAVAIGDSLAVSISTRAHQAETSANHMAMMQFLTIAALTMVAVSAWPPPPPDPPKRGDAVLVRHVIDGDTIDVTGVGRVRLLGIDAPELGRGFDTPAPFAREARARLAGLVTHRWVRLDFDGGGGDAFNRRTAYVFLETGEFVNALLVGEGLARVTARHALSRLGELKRAEAEAQTLRRGMWGAMPSRPTETYVLPRRPARPRPR
jgi:endonuclease YncB( thermonuclease family)